MYRNLIYCENPIIFYYLQSQLALLRINGLIELSLMYKAYTIIKAETSNLPQP